MLSSTHSWTIEGTVSHRHEYNLTILALASPLQVYCLSQPTGTRDEQVHEVEAVVQQQAQPVPHGFLAKSIQAWGPLNLSHIMPSIHSAKMH